MEVELSNLLTCDEYLGSPGFINTILRMEVKLKNKDTVKCSFFALFLKIGCHIKQGGKFNEKTN